MSRTTRLALLAALPVAMLSVCSLAQNAAPAKAARPSFFQHMLEKMDTNGDGRISLDEYVAAATARFKSIDTQNKGNIGAAEMMNSPAAAERIERRAEFMVKHLDKAGNGYITKDEFLAAAQKRFARMDKTGTGKLTADELTAPGRGRGHRGGAAQQSTDGEHASKRAEFAQKYFDKLDANHDGVVTQDEYLAAAAAQFQQFDAQGNGQVTASEIAASPKVQQRATHVAEHMVKRLDTNGDGVVSQDEYLTAAKARFAKLDKNGDGFIDADEMSPHHWARSNKATPASN